jgi:hypothetical protein
MADWPKWLGDYPPWLERQLDRAVEDLEYKAPDKLRGDALHDLTGKAAKQAWYLVLSLNEIFERDPMTDMKNPGLYPRPDGPDWTGRDQELADIGRNIEGTQAVLIGLHDRLCELVDLSTKRNGRPGRHGEANIYLRLKRDLALAEVDRDRQTILIDTVFEIAGVAMPSGATIWRRARHFKTPP